MPHTGQARGEIKSVSRLKKLIIVNALVDNVHGEAALQRKSHELSVHLIVVGGMNRFSFLLLLFHQVLKVIL